MAGQKFNPQNTLKKAQKLHQEGQFYQAEQLYIRVIKANPAYGPAYHFLSETLIQQNKVDQARKVLDKGLARNPKDGDLLSSMSNFMTKMGDSDKGIEYAKRVVSYYPDRSESYYNLANLQLHLGQQEEAMASLQKAVEIKPDFPEAQYNLGTLLYDFGQIDAAEGALTTAIESNPNLLSAYLNLGFIAAETNRFTEAQDWYQKILDRDPKYSMAYQKIGMVHHVTGHLAKAEESYKQALEFGGDNAELQTLLGNLMRDLGRPAEAIPHYEKALKLDPKSEIAKTNIQELRQKRIFNWHFTMLADTSRNDAFDAALKASITPDSIVLDIGTGSGLLSMMAARAGAKEVIACEMVPDLAQIATQIVADNKLSETVSIYNEKSTALEVGKQLPEKADILVSEILDIGLIGEGVLTTFRHAIKNLIKPNATIIPQAAKVYAVLIECEELAKVNPVKQISGFDLSSFESIRGSEEYQGVKLNQLNHRQLSEVFEATHFDFRQPPITYSLLEPNVTPLEVAITQPGTLHGIAFWFDLHLTDDISLSSGPQGEMVHWGQAMYFFEDHQKVEAGNTIDLELLQSEVLMRFRKK